MSLITNPEASRKQIFQNTEAYLGSLAIKIESVDMERPWGGFFVVDEASTEDFIEHYFSDFDQSQITKHGTQLSPKVLLVEPGKKLSWQYHDRRAELWRVIAGPVGIIRSDNDEQGGPEVLNSSDTAQFDQGVRHRLIGLNKWGIVAEIWQHTDPVNPSDEQDITRISDDFGR